MHGFVRMIAYSTALAVLTASPVMAKITINTATISKGQLVVEGTSTTGTQVKLDNAFTAPLGSLGTFKFGLPYLPADCIVDIVAVGGASTAKAVIANCGPKGVNPLGLWSPVTKYVENDLVTLSGSTWRALANANTNLNRNPASTSGFWQKFVSKGDAGATGPAGADGAQGPAGPAGAVGPAGPAGAAGAQGPAGAIGPAGPQGRAGLTAKGAWKDAADYVVNDVVTYEGSSWRAIDKSSGAKPPLDSASWELLVAKGDPGIQGATGPQGAPGSNGAQGATGAQGSAGPQGPQGPQGFSGFNGSTGPQGPQGPQGAPGTAYVKRIPFDDTGLPLLGSEIQLVSTSITAPATGNVIARAEGTCAITHAVGNAVIDISASPPNGSQWQFNHDWGQIELPFTAPPGVYRSTFVSSRQLNVLGGIPQDIVVFARRNPGSDIVTCRGIMTIEFYTGVLN